MVLVCYRGIPGCCGPPPLNTVDVSTVLVVDRLECMTNKPQRAPMNIFNPTCVRERIFMMTVNAFTDKPARAVFNHNPFATQFEIDDGARTL